jgi:hypothetical protein
MGTRCLGNDGQNYLPVSKQCAMHLLIKVGLQSLDLRIEFSIKNLRGVGLSDRLDRLAGCEH